MKSGSLVSVLVPTYNGERYLADALACATRQTYRNIEILVRDDGSSDATRSIVETYRGRDRRIVLVPDDGRRLGGTGNMAELLALASGEFVKFLHQDDLLERACVERLVRPLRFDSSLTMATSSRRMVGSAGQEIATSHPAYRPLQVRNGKLAGHDVLRQMATTLLNALGEPSVALFRNGVVRPEQAFALDGVQYSYMNDMALWTNLLLAGDLYWVAEPLSSFRTHEGQRSAQLHEAITAAGELACFATFGVEHGLLQSRTEFLACARTVSSAIRGLEALVAGAADHERAERTADLAEAVARFRLLVESGELVCSLEPTS